MFRDSWLLCLLPVSFLPVFLAFYLKRKRYREVTDFVGKKEGDRVSAEILDWYRISLKVLALVLMILALAGPQGNPHPHPLSIEGRDVVFVLDVSRSMLAEDLKPNRLERSKLFIRECVEKFQSDRVGLVIYAGSAVVRCPLTRDYAFFLNSLSGVGPEDAEIGGTRIGDALLKVCDKLFMDEVASYRDVILITDGEDHATDLEVSETINAKGIHLMIAGVGDKDMGARIPMTDGTIKYQMYEDHVIWTRLQEEPLRELIKQCDQGMYISVGEKDLDLFSIYKEATNRLDSGFVGEDTVVIYDYYSHWFALMSLVLVILSRFNPIRIIRSSGSMAFLFLFFCSCNGPMKTNAVSEGDLLKQIENAQKAFEEDRYSDASMIWENLGKVTDQAIFIANARLNSAICSYQATLGYIGTEEEEMMYSELNYLKTEFQELIKEECVKEKAAYNYEVIHRFLEWLNRDQSNENQQSDSGESGESGENSENTEESDSNEMSEDDEFAEGEGEEGDLTSEMTSGSFSEGGSGMPAPSDSPDDILGQFEAMQSLREKGKSSTASGNVKKDW